MDEPRRCGQGLAQHATLPAKLAEFLDAVADTLAGHQQALDPSDANSRQELVAYVELAQRHRAVASELAAIARLMESYRDLPMGRHDAAALTNRNAFAVFEKLVRREEELLSVLRHGLTQDHAMLGEMDTATSSGAR